MREHLAIAAEYELMPCVAPDDAKFAARIPPACRYWLSNAQVIPLYLRGVNDTCSELAAWQSPSRND